MPWIAPSHQAPALLLKLWRPRWFSGLGLVLGTMAPDLEFILRLDGAVLVSHTVLAQLYFTAPFVVVLYLLSVELVIPWVLRYCPDGPPFHWHELAAMRRPVGREWLLVMASGAVGGLTHIALDGFTHGDASGWAVARSSALRARVGLLGGVPVYDVLQIVFTVIFGALALRLWRRMARERLLWKWRGLPPRGVPQASQVFKERMARWLVGCVLAGIVLAVGLRPIPSLGLGVERAAYGALTFFAGGLLVAAVADRIVRTPGWRAEPPGDLLPGSPRVQAVQ